MDFWPPKDPDEILDYYVDWTSRLNGDTIAESTFTVKFGTVVIQTGSTSFTDTITRLWLEGGLNNEIAKVLNQIVTLGGRVMEATIGLRILDK